MSTTGMTTTRAPDDLVGESADALATRAMTFVFTCRACGEASRAAVAAGLAEETLSRAKCLQCHHRSRSLRRRLAHTTPPLARGAAVYCLGVGLVVEILCHLFTGAWLGVAGALAVFAGPRLVLGLICGWIVRDELRALREIDRKVSFLPRARADDPYRSVT